ncbi:MAG TPA: thiol reductant ABC exporter subunit CydC [Chromatiaceae bacterium]|nr:thiol reductant ABC exporter subunit CydC [Chromatiaceae bacterium]
MSQYQLLKRLLGMIRAQWGVMIISILMRVLNQGSAIALLVMGAWGVSLVVMGRGDEIGRLLWLMVGLGLFKGVFRYLEQFTGHYLAFHLLAKLRRQFYRRIEPLAPAGLADTRSGDLISRAIADVDKIEVFYAHTIAPAAVAIIVPAIALIFLAQRFHALLALALLPFLVGVGALLPWLFNRPSQRFAMQTREQTAEVNAHLTDSIQGLREVLAFGYANRRRQEIWTRGELVTHIQRDTANLAGLQNALMDGLIAAGTLAVLGVAIGLWRQGALDLVAFPPILALATTSFAPVIAASAVLNEFNVAMAGARRLFALMDREPLVQEIANNQRDDHATLYTPQSTLSPSLHFENVFFQYQPFTPESNGHTPEWVLNNLSFDVPEGSTVALVGSSGAGKSTIINLLLRFWDVNEGQVRLGDVNVRDLPQMVLRDQIAVVSQQTHIFYATIKQNLLFGKPTATDAEIEQAAQLANIHDFIVSLPDGYETAVGEMGVKLSGGQRQRLSIARALLKDAPILLLDEATSNLDAETEREIQSAIYELMQGRTVLLIAHRLSTVINADEILVLENGSLAERGTHSDLLAQNGVYARLFAHQRDAI